MAPESNAPAPASPSDENPAVPHPEEYSLFLTTVALGLWLGAIHFNVALVLAALFLFPARLAAAVFGLLLFLMVIPLNDENPVGIRLSKFICKYAVRYFPLKLHVENKQAFDPNRAYVFGYEPHSILPVGTLFASTGLIPIPKIKILATSAIFYTPFLRHIWNWLGVVPASRKNFYAYLAAGYSCVVVPGGVQEMAIVDHNKEVLFLKSKKGFVKIAMEMGTPIVPVFCFGQRNVFKWWKLSGKLFVRISRALKFAPVVFWGRFGSPIPFRSKLYVVVGQPIEITRNSNPTMDEINEVHAQYVHSLKEIVEKYKSKAEQPNLQLEIR